MDIIIVDKVTCIIMAVKYSLLSNLKMKLHVYTVINFDNVSLSNITV